VVAIMVTNEVIRLIEVFTITAGQVTATGIIEATAIKDMVAIMDTDIAVATGITVATVACHSRSVFDAK
jgi:hypothetical protein